MLDLRIDVTGFDELIAALRALPADAMAALEAGLYDEATAIMADSQQNYVPVDSGVLRSAGVVPLPERDGDTVTVRLGYGGAAEAYALMQHEHLEFHHPHGGQAKYLERPFLARQTGLFDRLAARVTDAIAQGASS